MKTTMGRLSAWAACALTWGGCVSQARVELSAADALEAVAVETQRAATEFSADLDSADAAREASVIGAFVSRTRRDQADEALMDKHTGDFAAALAKIREDRRVAWERQRRVGENCRALRETAAGLRQIAVQSTSLDDELKRYVTGLLTRHGSTATVTAATGRGE
ncbi:MAG: hypothetical protein U1A27_04870 [Phycisphaerae bacterium]